VKSIDQVCKDILEKKAIDYVGAYELIKHNKMKKECFDQQSKNEPHSSQKSDAAQKAFFET
jgi:hypothetical protein